MGLRVRTSIILLAATAALFAGQSAAVAAGSYRPVCETTDISRTRGGPPVYTVQNGENVNVRSIRDGFAETNYPARGFLRASALCPRTSR